MRDSQRQRVYDAENKARAILTKAGQRFTDVSTEARYRRRLDEIMASKWMHETYPEATRRVVDLTWSQRKRYGAHAGYCGITTSQSAFALHEMVLIHELAHTIEKRIKGIVDPGHGRYFCRIYLSLVRRFISAAAHDELRAQFKAHKVRYTLPRKRTLPQAPRQLPPALAAANEARKAKAAAEFYSRLTGAFAPGTTKASRYGDITARRDSHGAVVFRRGWSVETHSIDDGPEALYAAWKAFTKAA